MTHSTSREYNFDDLPEEIIRIIFSYLPDFFVFTNLRLVNRNLKQIVDEYVKGSFRKPLVLEYVSYDYIWY